MEARTVDASYSCALCGAIMSMTGRMEMAPRFLCSTHGEICRIRVEKIGHVARAECCVECHEPGAIQIFSFANEEGITLAASLID